MKRPNKIKMGRKIIAGLLAVFASFGVGYSAWAMNPKTSVEEEVVVETTNEVAVCYNKQTNVIYSSVAVALEKAESGQTIFVYPKKTITVNENLVIKAGTTLSLPYDSNETTKSYTATDTGRNILINMRTGADIIVNGTLTIGAILGTRGIVKAYSEINLGNNSSITVNSGGSFNCYGKVTEGETILNGGTGNNVGMYDNSFDSQRFISVENGALLTTALASYDMPSGSGINNLNNANVCPTYVFDFHCLQTYVFFKFGSKMNAIGYVSTGVGSSDATIGVIRPSGNSDKSMFYLKSGNIGIEYCSADKTILFLDGEADLGSLYISASGVSIDTSGMFIPLSYKFSVYVGGIFNTNGHNIKFLPGSYAKVLETGTININSKAVFYTGTTLAGYDSSVSVSYNSYSKADSTFINDGTFNLLSNGSFGGYIQTTRSGSGESPVVNLSNVTNQANLSVTTTEGVGKKNIPMINASGPFFDSEVDGEIADYLFKAGTVVHTHEKKQCWDGEKNNAKSISIKVSNLYKHNLFSYSCYSNTTNSNSGQESLLENEIGVLEFVTERLAGEYFKLVDSTCASITLNGSAYTSGTWVKISSDLEFIITPKEAYEIKFSLGGSSGAGSQTYTIKYGTSSSSLKTTFTSESHTGSKLLQVGYYFSIKPSDWGGAGYTATVKKTTYDASGKGTVETLFSGSDKKWGNSKDNQVWPLDGDYSFSVTGWSLSVCLLSTSQILMSDGVYKSVKDITLKDELMSYNMITRRIEAKPIMIYEKDFGFSDVISLLFEDNRTIGIVGQHLLFDKTLNSFVTIDLEHWSEYIGHDFTLVNGDDISGTKLVSVEVETKEVEYYSIATANNFNIIANGLLTNNPPYDIYNYLKMDDNEMGYDLDQLERDIAEYGLYDYEVFEPYGISREFFDAFNGKYLKIAVGKGVVTFEQIIGYIDYYKHLFVI